LRIDALGLFLVRQTSEEVDIADRDSTRARTQHLAGNGVKRIGKVARVLTSTPLDELIGTRESVQGQGESDLDGPRCTPGPERRSTRRKRLHAQPVETGGAGPRKAAASRERH